MFNISKLKIKNNNDKFKKHNLIKDLAKNQSVVYFKFINLG